MKANKGILIIIGAIIWLGNSLPVNANDEHIKFFGLSAIEEIGSIVKNRKVTDLNCGAIHETGITLHGLSSNDANTLIDKIQKRIDQNQINQKFWTSMIGLFRAGATKEDFTNVAVLCGQTVAPLRPQPPKKKK